MFNGYGGWYDGFNDEMREPHRRFGHRRHSIHRGIRCGLFNCRRWRY